MPWIIPQRLAFTMIWPQIFVFPVDFWHKPAETVKKHRNLLIAITISQCSHVIVIKAR
jgi:hypothetical protein